MRKTIHPQKDKLICQICHQHKASAELYPAELVRPALASFIQSKHPDWDNTGYICLTDLNKCRAAYIAHMMDTEQQETESLEAEVVKSLQAHELLSKNINEEFDEHLGFGDRIADRIAEFGGSWKFIITFAVILIIWILINSLVLLWRPFDPYPFILLNLILSCLAAIQAPIIMMSQNRQEVKDRMRSEHDYQVNLKAEMEIRYLHEKLDHLLMKQWQHLMEIQQLQTEIMEEILAKKPH